MKVTYNWLKEFVDIKMTARSLADKLTMAGLEVVSLEEKSADFVFEIEITSNRPDWLSVVGIAREVAAITGAKIKPLSLKPGLKKAAGYPLKIIIEDKKDCPLYTARVFKEVKVGPSPQWLKARLELLGCRSVNNVVDITNYVLFELGAPLHAFDLSKLSGEEINVRRSREGEKIITIDSLERNLIKGTLIIADKDRPIAIAGVMGGRDTEVGSAAKEILLEAAVFNPVLVRKGRQAEALQSESSYRFERGVDPLSTQQASLRAAQLMQELCQAQEVCFKASGLATRENKLITLSLDKAENILGLAIKPIKARQILSALGFSVKQSGKGNLLVRPPSFRQDVRLAEDLIEEIARVFGYERIPVTLPKVYPYVAVRQRRDFLCGVKNILTGLGLSEAITYSLTDSATLAAYNPLIKPIELMNPLSSEQGFLRTTLIPGLVESLAHNLNQKQGYVGLFEAANVFSGKAKEPQEELKLGIVLSGMRKALLSDATVSDEAGVLHLKGIIEALFLNSGAGEVDFIGRGEAGVAVLSANEEVGFIRPLGRALLEKAEIKNREVFAAELALDRLIKLSGKEKKYLPLSRYPGITRDVSFILKKESPVKEIIRALEKTGRPLLLGVRIADYYQGKQIPQGYRGLTISCSYGSSERTLTEEEVQPVHELICAELTDAFGAKIR